MNRIENFITTFSDALKELRIDKNDILYVASDIKVLLHRLALDYGIRSKQERDIVLNQIVDCFQRVLGKNGTLLFPVFSWSFCRGTGFDYKKTKGEVGSFSNWVMSNRTDFIRTQHPIYSFMVWGADAEYLANRDYQDGWGECSPFSYFRSNHAKQLLFNIEAYQGFTFCHYVEQCIQVPYRHPKYFFGEYTDAEGKKEIRSYSMYVRDRDVLEEVGVHNRFLIEHKVANQTVWQENVLTVVDLEKSFTLMQDDMWNNNGKNTLRFRDYDFNWEKKQTVPYEIGNIPVRET